MNPEELLKEVIIFMHNEPIITLIAFSIGVLIGNIIFN